MSGAFPTAGSTVYRNEAGEVLGWDNDSYYEPEYDPDLGMGDDYEGEEWCRRCGESMGSDDTWLWFTGDPLASGHGSYVCKRHKGEPNVVDVED